MGLATTARSLIIVGVLWFACDAHAQAQDFGTRQGWWFRGAVGYGSAHVSCDSCRSGRHLDGYTVQLGIGGAKSPELQLGAVLEVWEHSLDGGQTLTAMTMGTASLYYYPGYRRRFFLEGGVGLSDYRVVKGLHEGFLFENADATPVSGTGLGFTAGFGYDVRVGRGVAIVPRVAYAHGDVGTLHSPSGASAARGWGQDVLSVSEGVKLWESAN